MVLLEINGRINKFEKNKLEKSGFENIVSQYLGYKARLTCKYFMHSGAGIKREEALNLLDNLEGLRDLEPFKSQSSQQAIEILINELLVYNNNNYANPYQYEKYVTQVIDYLLFVAKVEHCTIHNEIYYFDNLDKPIEYYENELKFKKVLVPEIEHLINSSCPILIGFNRKEEADIAVISIKKGSMGEPLTDEEGNVELSMQIKSEETIGFDIWMQHYLYDFPIPES